MTLQSQTVKIHEKAIVGEKAILGSGVEIGPYAIVEDGAVIGDRTKVFPHAFISRYTKIGQDCLVHIGAVLGADPQSTQFDPSVETFLEIGDNNILREYVTIHRSTDPQKPTRIGKGNFIMAQTHIGHDCQVGNYNIIANNALIAGHVEIGDHVFISGGVPIHQFVRIGSYAMLSGWSAVSLDVPPYMIAQGPNMVKALNVIGLKRNGISKEAIATLQRAYKILYRSYHTIPEALKELEKLEDHSGHVKHLIDFIRSSKRGICRSGTGRE